jgi:hypothetical protein
MSSTYNMLVYSQAMKRSVLRIDCKTAFWTREELGDLIRALNHNIDDIKEEEIISLIDWTIKEFNLKIENQNENT